MDRAIDNRSTTVFGLCFEGNRDCHTLIFTVDIYRDLDLGSISMEAYVVPFTASRVRELKLALSRLPNIGIILSDAESILWKRMLPALAERCCTWKHKSTVNLHASTMIMAPLYRQLKARLLFAVAAREKSMELSWRNLGAVR